MKIYKRIRELREDNDLTQKEIAAAIGITQRSYSYYENGKRALPPEIIVALAEYYNVSADYILEITDNII
ncbi:MAG: helix-turn-helix transcriptional regulator [Oscillospiraceae bacterium]|nr:helix-turn-helix transcriptional regulator [Oscillospiraceae bacterium]